MCCTKKRGFVEYEYNPNVGKGCGVSLWFFFYLNLFITIILLLFCLYMANLEVKESEKWSLESSSDVFLIWNLIGLSTLLSFYTAFLAVIFFAPVRFYWFFELINFLWFCITWVYMLLIILNPANDLHKVKTVPKFMHISMLLLILVTPLTLCHSSILQLVMCRIRFFMKKDEVQYKVINGAATSVTKPMFP